MSAEGYRSDPLSAEMERRIRERIAMYHSDSRPTLQLAAGALAALEWVLHEAEALKEERRPSVADRVCFDCRHEHESRNECGKYLGEGRFCHCEAKVPA